MAFRIHVETDLHRKLSRVVHDAPRLLSAAPPSPHLMYAAEGSPMRALTALLALLLAAGALIDRIGFAATATLYTVVGLVCTLAIALYWRTELWDADAHATS